MVVLRFAVVLSCCLGTLAELRAQKPLQWVATEEISEINLQASGDAPTLVDQSQQSHSSHQSHLSDQSHSGHDVAGESAAPGHESAAACASCQCGKQTCHGVCTDPGRPGKPKREMPGDRNVSDCPPYRYRIPDCQRAGNPHCVAKWAQCSVTSKYSSWFVGGGAAFCRGRCRKPTEGTWGLDYDGYFGKVNNWLNYTRGRKQGGEGAYATDGEPEFVKKAHALFGLGH